jgi:hypothetical protein
VKFRIIQNKICYKLTLEVKLSKSLSLEDTAASDSTTDDISLDEAKRLALAHAAKAPAVDGANAEHCLETETIKSEIAIGWRNRVMVTIVFFSLLNLYSLDMRVTIELNNQEAIDIGCRSVLIQKTSR